MEPTQTPFEALKVAVAAAGSQSALARICGVSQTAVWKWLQSGKRLPAEFVLDVESETGVSKHDLRPDIYPRSLPAVGVPNDLTEEAEDVPCDQHGALQAARRA